MKKKLTGVVLAVGIALVALTGCQTTGNQESSNAKLADSETSEAEKVLIVAQSTDCSTLDPVASNDIVEDSMFKHLFQTLCARDRDMNVIPGLATEWETVTEDNLTWQFKLRENVKFHDGSTMTADDVVLSFDRYLGDEAGGNTSYALGCALITKVERVDDYTVKITTSAPNPMLPNYLQEFPIMSKTSYEDKTSEEVTAAPVGCGPYKLVEWVKGDHLTMERFDDYYGELPEAQKIIWRTIPEAETRLQELNMGTVDIAEGLTPDMVSEVDTAVATATTVETTRRMFVGFSYYGHPSLQKKEVRQALNYALDFDAINEAFLFGQGSRLGTFVNEPFANEAVTPYPYDIEKAKSLMAEAGYTDTDGDGYLEDENGEEITYVVNSPNGKYTRDAEMVQSYCANLEELGIHTSIQFYEWSVLNEKFLSFDVADLWFRGHGSTCDGAGDLAQIVADNGINYGKCDIPEFEKEWEELNTLFDNDERQAVLDEMQVTLKEDPPYVYFTKNMQIFGISNKISWEPWSNERLIVFEAKWK